MGAFEQGEQGTVGTVVDLTVQRIAIFIVIEVAQVGFKFVAITQVSHMHQAKIVLLINIVQHAIEITGLQVLGDVVSCAAKVQAVTVEIIGGAKFVQFLVVGRFPCRSRPETAAGHRQPIDFLGLDHGPLVDGIQLPTGVIECHRQLWAKVTDLQLGLAVAHLQGCTGATVVIGRLLVTDAVRQRTVVARRIQAHGVLRIHIKADCQGCVGVTGSKLRIETLRPTMHFRNRRIVIGVVTVQVEVTRVHFEVTVINNIGIGCQWRTDHSQHAGNTEPTARLFYLIHLTSPHLYVLGTVFIGADSN
ncbi:hypothetical protein D3C81_1035360 [compost metagenome]